MWLALPTGFYSIVAIPHAPGMLLVRARMRKHLVAAQREGGLVGPISVTPKSDYRFRLIDTRANVMAWVLRSMQAIGYTNFKDAAHDRWPKDQRWHRALGNVWMDMYELQDPRPLPPPMTLDEIDAIERRLGLDPRKNPPPPQEG